MESVKWWPPWRGVNRFFALIPQVSAPYGVVLLASRETGWQSLATHRAVPCPRLMAHQRTRLLYTPIYLTPL